MLNNAEANDEQKKIDDTYANEFILFKNEKDKNETIDFLLNYRRKSYILSNDLARISTLILFISGLYGTYANLHTTINHHSKSDTIILLLLFFLFLYVTVNDICVTAFTYLNSIKFIKKSFKYVLKKYHGSRILRAIVNIGILILPFLTNTIHEHFFKPDSKIAIYIIYIMITLIIIIICFFLCNFYKKENKRQYYRIMYIAFISNIALIFVNLITPLTFSILLQLIKTITTKC
ncbi:hypothetical protein [Commensalibacter communis]|uniref:Uncharacterized protein n=1 Tax=Commensalibacter communis TaxID=2972786 RepID=A0A9W4TTG7_9PROT|nr:hypothetical protein [Commensalibacter communis]CAI3952130.1 unnamed protein product [Commensalibacter communis]CAI3958432.1 unnamed protein product [Commensalibacter communis]CAI3959641.1 unnamed protein product [Commensalibacter communis]CAI3960313.1 unnamed protein product [Commensalibacter communis]CAI3960339.1 unnamed protein product [Commensalibacter communis]